MNSNQTNSPFPAAQQVFHNTISWLGHRPSDHQVVSTGQTFIAVKEGDLDNIEVFSSVVTSPGIIHMTIHQYDAIEDIWGPVLGSTTVEVNSGQNDRWLAFKIPGLHLNKGVSYGFKLESNDTFLALGEAVGSVYNRPYESGTEWRFNKSDKKNSKYQYFSLAFKVGLCAS